MGLLKKLPVLPEDIDNYQSIYVPYLHFLKGKTVRSSPTRFRTNFIQVTPFILERNKKITLACDVMYINNITFFVTISENICFTKIDNINNRLSGTIFKSLKYVISVYNKRGFKVYSSNVDN